MQEIDFQLTPGIPVFSFDFSYIDAYLATFNSRNQFIIFIQNRLKGTQKGPKREEHIFFLADPYDLEIRENTPSACQGLLEITF
jgi:hypothetical protein